MLKKQNSYRTFLPVHTKKQVRLEIILERQPISVYKSGEIIYGRVRIRSGGVITIQNLYVELLGRAVVVAPRDETVTNFKRFTQERKELHEKLASQHGTGCIITGINGPLDSNNISYRLRSSNFKEFRSLVATYQTVNEEVYCSEHLSLISEGDPEGCELLLAGDHFYSFEFHLPESCPCSFSGTRGSIEYRLRTSMELSSGSKLVFDKGISVIRDLVLDKMAFVSSTFACPPISRNFISSFDYFTAQGKVSPLIGLAHAHNQHKLFPNELCKSTEPWYSSQSSLKSHDTNQNANDLHRESVYSLTSNSGSSSNQQLSRNQNNLRLRNSQSHLADPSQNHKERRELKAKCKHLITRSQLSEQMTYDTYNKPALVVNRCSDNSIPLPSSWLAYSSVTEPENYPRSCLGAQTGYPISCRLTLSSRNLVPGDRCAACLTLLVEDPFALIVAPAINPNTGDLNWCAQFKTNLKNKAEDIWSPLARAFVSYFLEDSIRKEVNGSKNSSTNIWWKGLIKRPYRIYVILRQTITYRDFRYHVIAQEERDLYSGELVKRPSSDNHLLRVVLENVFRIPSIPPTDLEGCSCISTNYSVGVVYYEMKQRQQIWIPTRIHKSNLEIQDDEKPVEVELLFAHDNQNPKAMKKSNKFQTMRFKQILQGSYRQRKRQLKSYQELLLPIQINVGTSRIGTMESNPYIDYQPLAATLGQTFYMQWPNSIQTGSLPAFYPFHPNDSDNYKPECTTHKYHMGLLKDSTLLRTRSHRCSQSVKQSRQSLVGQTSSRDNSTWPQRPRSCSYSSQSCYKSKKCSFKATRSDKLSNQTDSLRDHIPRPIPI